MTQQSYTDIDMSKTIELDGRGTPETGELVEIKHTAVPEIAIAPEGHLLLVLPAGEIVTGTMATMAAVEVDRLVGTSKIPMLLVLTGIEALTRNARTVFSDAASFEAVAVLGVSPVDRVIANFLLGGNIQPCPTKYFTTEPEALAWLQRKHGIA